MSRWTHITMLDGRSRLPLVDSVRPFPDQIRYSLNRLDGASPWGYSLWRAPEGANLLASLPVSDEYLQCAGTAEAMTVEVRTIDPDGVAHQYTVGRSGGDDGAEPVAITWDGGRHSTTVHAHEVFTADEAAEIFYAYFLADRVRDPYVLRELDLTWPPPDEEGPREAEDGADDRIAVEVHRVASVKKAPDRSVRQRIRGRSGDDGARAVNRLRPLTSANTTPNPATFPCSTSRV